MKNFIPRGWVKNTNEELQKVYNEACNKAMELGMVDYVPDLYIFKSTKTWGWARYPQKHDYGKRPYIGLNAVYLQEPAKALNTICHELAHIASPRGTGHGQTWKHNFAKIGVPFGLHRFERCSSSEYVGLEIPKQYKYEAYCSCCGRSWKRQKKIKLIQYPELYQCPVCKQKLRSREI